MDRSKLHPRKSDTETDRLNSALNHAIVRDDKPEIARLRALLGAPSAPSATPRS